MGRGVQTQRVRSLAASKFLTKRNAGKSNHTCSGAESRPWWPKSMIACFDVHYDDHSAVAAAIAFRGWDDETIVDQHIVNVKNVGEYRAGRFFERELKPLRELLPLITHPLHYYVIDAYCHLSQDLDPGLGAYLKEHLPADAVVIGVAKNRFRDTNHAIELYRGSSDRPLFVTSIGVDYPCAANYIKSMAGNYRIPTLLKLVDSLSRKGK